MSLEQLLEQGAVWRASDTVGEPCVAGFYSGHEELDQMLNGQGWQPGSLVEMLYDTEGCGELRLLLPLLAASAERWVLWVDPPHIPYAPALKAAGVALDRLLLVRSNSRRDRLWCLEQALKSGCCSAVLGWLGDVPQQALRRLQLAAAQGQGLGFIFRPTACREQHSAAPYRLLLEPDQAPDKLAVSVLKRRGGWPLPRRVLSLRQKTVGRRAASLSALPGVVSARVRAGG
ncbi:translesion DNA synthesis-associated protein ImuA [Marinobacterium rhizophilum]|uniref:Translesion DNA synthesis-associated protein ImuA n=1 Tax=Marinobacterium rhizophilum TaxID=420402 RepID=A0ABY5HJI1_9GAMM|nr:translesion DNA synthesis-associated protein ImuA [Marinobacterium rhizophilum]UTW11121.1 translesion DNA synthesis-associated protein ImuA [Marinobacterium rhizophilum]